MLDLLRRGYTARKPSEAQSAARTRSDWRQFAIIDKEGAPRAFAGRASTRNAPRRMGATASRSPTSSVRRVPAAIVQGLRGDPKAHLALRLIDALEAGDEAGGEFKPLMSAGLIIAYREAFPYVDLRVDSDPDPIETMRQLWQEYEPVADMFVARAVQSGSS